VRRLGQGNDRKTTHSLDVIMMGSSEFLIIVGVYALVGTYLLIVHHFIRSGEVGTTSVRAVAVSQISKRDRFDSAPAGGNPVRA
jgi:hypothetical protein